MAKKGVSHDNKKIRYLQSEIETAKKERNKSLLIASLVLAAFVGVILTLSGLWNSGIIVMNEILFYSIMFICGIVFCGIDMKHWKDFNKCRDYIASCEDKLARIKAQQ